MQVQIYLFNLNSIPVFMHFFFCFNINMFFLSNIFEMKKTYGDLKRKFQ